MTEKTVDEKIKELKAKLLSNKVDKVIFKDVIKENQKKVEYKNIKNKNRKRAKLQKKSRKNNR